MPTGYEVQMYNDLHRARLALETIAEQSRKIAAALELGASANGTEAAQVPSPAGQTEDARGDT